MKSPKAPKAPDPNQVSAAQTQSNEQTAAYNNAQSHGNTATPWGSQTFTSHVDPTTGATVYDQSVNLSPEQQQLYNTQTQQDLSLANTGNNLAGQIGSQYGSDFNPELSKLYGADDLTGARQAASDALYKQQTAYLDPQYAQRENEMRTRLANQGITEGSEAWHNAIDDFDRGRTFDYQSARNSADSAGLAEMQGLSQIASNNRNQQLSEALTRRELPMNELAAVRGQSQVQVPQFQNPNSAAVAPTNSSQDQWNAYNAALNIWNTKAGQQGGFLNGLMGLGGQLGSAWIMGGK